MDRVARELLEASQRTFVAHERRWWVSHRRGRWVVVEPGPGRLLGGASRRLRAYVDRISERRGRRFSSLSRARAFAREVGGEVRRWHRAAWRVTSPWYRATRAVAALPYLGGL